MIDQAESEKSSSAFVLSQAEIENELRRHGSGFAGGKQRIMALYQTQPDRKLCAKALAKEYGIGGHRYFFEIACTMEEGLILKQVEMERIEEE